MDRESCTPLKNGPLRGAVLMSCCHACVSADLAAAAPGDAYEVNFSPFPTWFPAATDSFLLCSLVNFIKDNREKEVSFSSRSYPAISRMRQSMTSCACCYCAIKTASSASPSQWTSKVIHLTDTHLRQSSTRRHEKGQTCLFCALSKCCLTNVLIP